MRHRIPQRVTLATHLFHLPPQAPPFGPSIEVWATARGGFELFRLDGLMCSSSTMWQWLPLERWIVTLLEATPVFPTPLRWRLCNKQMHYQLTYPITSHLHNSPPLIAHIHIVSLGKCRKLGQSLKSLGALHLSKYCSKLWLQNHKWTLPLYNFRVQRVLHTFKTAKLYENQSFSYYTEKNILDVFYNSSNLNRSIWDKIYYRRTY